MNIYLAGDPDAHEQFNAYAKELTADGFEVVSSWHQDSNVAQLVSQSLQQQKAMRDTTNRLFDSLFNGQESHTTPTERQALRGAPADQIVEATDRFLSEIESADVVIAHLNTASMEAGYALAKGKELIAIGSTTSLMIPFFIEKVKIVEDWASARGKLWSKRTLQMMGRKLPIPEEA